MDACSRTLSNFKKTALPAINEQFVAVARQLCHSNAIDSEAGLQYIVGMLQTIASSASSSSISSRVSSHAPVPPTTSSQLIDSVIDAYLDTSIPKKERNKILSTIVSGMTLRDINFQITTKLAIQAATNPNNVSTAVKTVTKTKFTQLRKNFDMWGLYYFKKPQMTEDVKVFRRWDEGALRLAMNILST